MSIDKFRLKTMLSALKLETLGMKRRGKSIYSIIKKEFNLKGNKQKVYEQFKIIVQKYNHDL
mgnify:CR=1 FL=1